MTVEALELLAGLVTESGARWGDAADQLQRDDAAAVLDQAEPRRHWIGRTRGYSKTTDVAGMTLAVMLAQAPAGARLYAAAADRDQARLLLDALGGFVDRTAELWGAIQVEAWRAATRDGVVLEVLAADAASAFGLRPWWLVVDELCQWDDSFQSRRFLEAITTALPKTPDARAIVTTTAGDPSHFSRGVYESAVSERELWRVSEAHAVAPWIDSRLVDAERRRLPDAAFRRYWRNEWTQSEDAVLAAEDVAACVTHAGPLEPQSGARYVLTVDLGWRRDRTALCVAHREPGDSGRVVVDRLEVFQGSKRREVDLAAVEDRVRDLADRYHGAAVFVDPAQAILLMQGLRRAGVNVAEHVFSSSSNTRLALRLLELVRAHRLALPDLPDLLDELCAIRITERGPGLFKVDSAPGGHDDQAIVVGMAALHLERAPGEPAESGLAALRDALLPFDGPRRIRTRADELIAAAFAPAPRSPFPSGSVQARIGGRPSD